MRNVLPGNIRAESESPVFRLINRHGLDAHRGSCETAVDAGARNHAAETESAEAQFAAASHLDGAAGAGARSAIGRHGARAGRNDGRTISAGAWRAFSSGRARGLVKGREWALQRESLARARAQRSCARGLATPRHADRFGS